MTLYEFYNQIRSPVRTILENELTKALIKKFITSSFGVGVKTWLIKYIVEHLMSDVAIPVANLIVQKASYEIEVINGQVLLKKIQNSTNLDEWIDNARRV